MQEEGGGKELKELKLINSGTFGCIYSPSINCDGKIGSAKYITKIQKSERSILNELRISEKIRNINGYVRYFAPVLKHCNVRIAKDRVKDLKKCEVFENESAKKIESSSYVSMKTRYLGKHDLKAHIFSFVESDKPSAFLYELLRTHTYLLRALQKLHSKKIVHYDLKSNNIMYDAERNSPIMIDFGQSWAMDELETEAQLSAAFFVFDQYDYWCIDIVICSYIFQKIGLEKSKTELVTETEMNHIYDVFMYGRESKPPKQQKNIENGAYLYNILLHPEKMSIFKTAVFDEYAKSFIGKRTWWELYSELIKKANTWDSYSLAVIYLNLIDDLFLMDAANFYNAIRQSSGQRMSAYVECLERVVYSAPNNRPEVQTVRDEIERIIRI
jgi:serine/threonine protein kinase